MVDPFIIGTRTRNAGDVLGIGVEILREGGSALDAVEAAIRGVEANPLDMGVGFGGIPNLLGVTQLDASIMDGRTLRTGAVAAVEGYLHPISIARRVMEESPHVLLVGSGAELFARVMGFQRTELLTDRSRVIYKAFIEDAIEDLDESFTSKEHLTRYVKNHRLREWYARLPDDLHGTVNVMALDENGDICSGVSTSGEALKFPGRVGDSPIIGAGNYCDNRVGASACVGRGELAIRLLTARTIISYMEHGMNVRDACIQAMRDIHALKEKDARMSCLAFDRYGNTMATSTSREPVYYYMDVGSKEPEERKGVWVQA